MTTIPYPSNYFDPDEDLRAQCRECGRWCEAGEISDVDEVYELDGTVIHQGVCYKCKGEHMDNQEMMQKCLRWYELQKEAAEIAAELEAETLTRGKTQNFGDVRITYSQPRKSYDYEAAWRNEYDHLPSTQYQTVSYDYRSACKDAEIEAEATVTGSPTAKIKLV